MLAVMKIVTYLAAVLAVLILVTGLAGASGAPQEAVVVSLALAVVLIPYAVTATAQRSRLIRLVERRHNTSELAAADSFSADHLRQSFNRE